MSRSFPFLCYPPFALQPTSHPCLRLSPSDLRFKNVRDIPENLRRFSEKVQRFSEKVQRFSEKLQHFQNYPRCLEEKLQLPSPHLPLFLTFHLAHNRSLLSASSCFCWHFSLPPRDLLSLLPFFINISTQSTFLSRFSYTRTRVYWDLHLFSFTTFTDIPYNLL